MSPFSGRHCCPQCGFYVGWRRIYLGSPFAVWTCKSWALSFAKANLQRILSVDQFAQAASLSLRQFNRLFRKETGSSPAQALERLRAEAARLMLESGSHSMDEIAQETGFGQRERIRRTFLRVFGQSPLAMRRITRAQVVSI